MHLVVLTVAMAQPQDPAVFAEQLDATNSIQARLDLLASNQSAVTPELARLSLERGQNYSRKSNQELATRSFQSALAVAQKLGDASLAAQAYRGIGLAHFRLGEATEALAMYQRGLEAAKSTVDRKLIADLLRGTGLAQRALGNFAESLTTDAQCLEIYREANDSLGMIAVLAGMGNAYARMGEFRLAVQNFEQCVKLGEAASNPSVVYRAIESIGSTYVLQGDNKLGLLYLEKSLALRQAGNASKAELTNININLTEAYNMDGRLTDALRTAESALALGSELEDPLAAAYALLNRAGVYRKLRRYTDALADLTASLAIYERQKTPLEIAGALEAMAQVELDIGQNDAALEHASRAADMARRIPVPAILWQALESTGIACRRMKRREQARAAFAEGVEIVDGLRKQLAGGEQQGLEFLRDKMSLFHGLVSLNVEFGDAEAALRVAERAKAGLILDVLRVGHAGITKAMTEAEKEREKQLVARVTYAQSRARRDPLAVDRAARELEAFRSELYAAHPELKIRRGESEPLSVADASKLLPDPATALLEFAVAPDATYLFTLTRDGSAPQLNVFKLDLTEAALARDVEAFRLLLASRDASYRVAATSLYQRLLGPASRVLRNRTVLAVVPDGPLWSLPFQALVQPDGRHVIEARAVFYAPSLTVLLESARNRRVSSGRKTLLAMGDPELDLANAAQEVTAVGRLYGASSAVLTGANASESKWKALAPTHEILHLAAHGVLNTTNPLYSYILMRAGNGEDGYIEAREILDLNLNASLVVLSACETGRGGFRYGEGVVGLSWALMVAGAPATVVSQWKVDSAGTTEFMLAFHRALRQGTSRPFAGKAAALRSAALRLSADSAYRHPYYWAGFALVGDGF